MTDDLTQAELFDVFSNARRRWTVRYLRGHGSCELSELVKQVAAWENGVEPEEITRTQRRRVYISLYQTHLPMLEEHEIVDWDPEEHTIELLADERTFRPYLDRDVHAARPWHLAYATVAVLGVVGVLVSAVLTGTAAPLVALGTSLLVLSVATLHTLSVRGSPPLPSPIGRR